MQLLTDIISHLQNTRYTKEAEELWMFVKPTILCCILKVRCSRIFESIGILDVVKVIEICQALYLVDFMMPYEEIQKQC